MTIQTKLAAFIETALAEPEWSDQQIKEPVVFDKMYEKRKKKGGLNLEMPIRNGDQADTFKWMTPTDTNSDYIGSTSGENNFTDTDPTVMERFTWAWASNEFKLNKALIKLYQSAENQLSDYVMDRFLLCNNQMIENIGNALFNGTGNGNGSALTSVSGAIGNQPYGLIYQDRIFSGTLNGNASNPATNVHLNLARHLHPQLVGNVFDATTHYGSEVIVTGATLTNGSTEISVLDSADYSAYVGWEVWVDLGQTGTYTKLGREFVIADTASEAATTLQMASVYRGSTDTAVNVKFKPPFNVAQHGAAGLPTLAKLNSAYFQASNGGKYPDLIAGNSRMFGSLMTILMQTKQFVMVQNADFKTKGHRGFDFNEATVTADDNIPSGQLHFIDTTQTKMFCVKNFDSYKVTEQDLIDLPNDVGFYQQGIEKLFPWQIVSKSPRNNAILKGLEV